MYSILRGIAASSLFAVALLGLKAGPAHAFTLAPAPIGGFDVGSNSTPVLADLDGDGDLDLISGEYYGTFRYYENTGSVTSASFVERTGVPNPLDGFDVGYYSVPTLADLDNDGDLDLVAGEESGAFMYFENTGSSMNPTFVARAGLDNPLDGFSTADYSAPIFADLDNDGDFDLIAGEGSGALLYFENTGSAASASFVAITDPASPLDGLSGDSYSTPALADLDADGDLDLVVGEYPGTFTYFENTGSALSPAFVQRTGVANPLDGFDMGFNARPAFSDLDFDGDFDIVSGEYDGTFRYLENTAPIINPHFTELTGGANPFDSFYLPGGYSAPVYTDLDNDGDLDVVSGGYSGAFRYFENTGSASSPAFVERTGASNPLDGFGVGYSSTPTLADLDGDGDLDVISGSYYGTFAYFENVGSAVSPAFVERTGGSNPLDGEVVGDFSAPALADLDGDGDFDLVSGEGYGDGVFLYYENTGSAVSPIFVERIGVSNPLDGFDVGGFSTPNLVDYDGDGDTDLVSGDGDGTFVYLENTGSVLSPAFTARPGTSSPFNGLDAGLSSTPGLADLNDDGILDVVSGESTGTFLQYVPEPLSWLGLTAGSAMLALFGRKKRRPADKK